MTQHTYDCYRETIFHLKSLCSRRPRHRRFRSRCNFRSHTDAGSPRKSWSLQHIRKISKVEEAHSENACLFVDIHHRRMREWYIFIGRVAKRFLWEPGSVIAYSAHAFRIFPSGGFQSSLSIGSVVLLYR